MNEELSEKRLAAISRRCQNYYCQNAPGTIPKPIRTLILADVPALIEEVRRLREEKARVGHVLNRIMAGKFDEDGYLTDSDEDDQ